MSNKIKNNYQFIMGTPDWVKPILIQEAQRTGVPTMLLSSQIKQESGFNAKAYSSAGAAGISQFIPSTARSYGLRVDDQVDERLDPVKAIRAQANYMADLIKQHGTAERALSSYNSGKPNAYLNPNFAKGETYNYVKNITAMSGVKGSINLKPITPTVQPQENIATPSAKFDFNNKVIQPSSQLKQSYLPQPAFDIGIKPQTATPSAATPFLPGMSERIRAITQPKLETVKIQSPQNEMLLNQPKPAPMPQQQVANKNIVPYRQPRFGAVNKGPGTINASFSAGRIPTPGRVSPMVSLNRARSHIVQRGETPGGLAQKYLGNWRRWREVWKGNPRQMPAGISLNINR